MTLFKSMQTDSVAPSTELDFLLNERISPQWMDFLGVFSAEMQSQLSEEEYRDLLKSMGNRMAERLPIGSAATIEELESVINRHLSRAQWGYVKLTDSGTQLRIQHALCPLPAALAVAHNVTGGFLEGMYEHWFRSAGADQDLGVKQVPEASSATVLEFLFGRHA